jgi:hypothetical protein
VIQRPARLANLDGRTTTAVTICRTPASHDGSYQQTLVTIRYRDEAPTRSSRTNSAWTTTRAATGAASTITEPYASRPMPSSWRSDSAFPPTALAECARSSKRLPYPKATGRAAAPRAQRHQPMSIATIRHQLAVALARALPRCPFCDRSPQPTAPTCAAGRRSRR